MPSQDARDTALSAALVMILTRQQSLLVAFRCRGARRGERRYNSAWLNVLIHTEEIIGIVFLFDRDQPVVIAAVGFLHAFLPFVAHQEVYVRAARGKRMHRIVITLCPGNDFLLIRRIRINADHYL